MCACGLVMCRNSRLGGGAVLHLLLRQTGELIGCCDMFSNVLFGKVHPKPKGTD